MNPEILSYIALAFGLIGAILAVVLFIYVYRWRMAFVIDDGDRKLALVPTDVLTKNNDFLKRSSKHFKKFSEHQELLARHSAERNEEIALKIIAANEELRKDQVRVFQDHQKLLETLAELREETKILRSEIQSQAEELDRHRKGYDTDILKASLIPVARMHRMISKDLQNEALAVDARVTLEALEDEHFEILETKGVKLVEPLTGARYRDQKNIKHPPVVEPAPEDELVGTIKEVLFPAYELETSAVNVVLLEAEVVIYSAPSQPTHAESETENELTEGN